VQNVFTQMELAVEQHYEEKTKVQIKMENVLQESDRLLTQALSVEIVNIVVHENMKSVCLNVTACARCVTTESELKTNFLHNECYDTLLQKYHTLEKHCITLEVNNQLNTEIFQRDTWSSQESAPTFAELFKINNLKAQAQAKDTVILKLKEKLNSLNGDVKDRHVKRDVEEIETLNIELDHKVTKLAAENKHLKQTYKQLYDSVKSSLKIATPTIVPPKEPIPIVNSTDKPIVTLVVQIVLWYLDSDCSKHMTRDCSQLVNFVQKFLGMVKFGNDHVAKIMGYGDYQIGNVTISRVYYVEVLDHNLFSVGQFCDSDLEVAFRQHTCFIRNLDGVDLLTGSRGNNLYTLSIQDMMASSPICLLSKASRTKSWLWHRCLSHLNFGAINHLAWLGLVRGLPKLKFEKDHLCSACAMGKSTRKTHKPKSEDTNQEKLYLLHMDLYGPMHNGTTFVNHTLRDYYEEVGISHETSVARSPQQNGFVERRNRTLIKAAHTMLIYAQAPLFLWAEAVATTCFTQNRSIIRLRHGKTLYELLHSKLPDLSFFHVFGALCYPTNDSENLSKLQPKADIGIFIGYASTKKAFRIYNRRTRKIMETIHVDFDELTAMASEHRISGPALNEMTPGTISSGLVPTTSPSTSYVPPLRNDWDLLFQQMFDELLNPPPSVVNQTPEVIAPIAEVIPSGYVDSTSSPSSTTVEQDAPSITHMRNDPLFGVPIPEVNSA
nr:hypothetical protein [Tanacetum cinerariifolium]